MITGSNNGRDGVAGPTEGQSDGGTGGAGVLRHDGVLELPEHKPIAVQGVRPDGRDRAAHGLQV